MLSPTFDACGKSRRATLHSAGRYGAMTCSSRSARLASSAACAVRAPEASAGAGLAEAPAARPASDIRGRPRTWRDAHRAVHLHGSEETHPALDVDDGRRPVARVALALPLADRALDRVEPGRYVELEIDRQLERPGRQLELVRERAGREQDLAGLERAHAQADDATAAVARGRGLALEPHRDVLARGYRLRPVDGDRLEA